MALSLAAGGLYLGTLSRQYSSDSCLYAVEIESAAWPAMVAPHHLLLHPLAWVWFRLWQAFGWTGEAMLPLQAVNALAGGVCVGLFFWHCTRVTSSIVGAVVAASGFAVCGGLWLLSTEAELVTIPLAVELLVLGWILRSADGETPSPAKLLALGASIGLSVLAYASTAALLPAAILALCTSGSGAQRRVRTTTMLLVGFALPVALGVLVAVNLLGPEGVVRAVLRPGRGYGMLAWQNLPRGAYAFLRTQVMFPGLGMSDRTLLWLQQATAAARMAFALTYLATGLAVAVPLVVVVARRRHVESARALLLWAALHVGFAFCWVPSDVSFWLPATAAWWLVVAVVAGDHRSAPRAVAVAVVLLLLVNGVGLMIPHHRRLPAGTAHPCEFILERAPATAR